MDRWCSVPPKRGHWQVRGGLGCHCMGTVNNAVGSVPLLGAHRGGFFHPLAPNPSAERPPQSLSGCGAASVLSIGRPVETGGGVRPTGAWVKDEGSTRW